MSWRHFTDKQWEKIKVHLPPRPLRPKGGRPPVDERKCFEGILWILWTGAPWSELPKEYSSPSTCWRRLQQWEQAGTLLELWRAFLTQLQDKDKLRWNECFADGSFSPAKKGDSMWVKPNAGREQSGWYWSMARVLRWEHTWTRRPHRRSNSSKKHSKPSK